MNLQPREVGFHVHSNIYNIGVTLGSMLFLQVLLFHLKLRVTYLLSSFQALRFYVKGISKVGEWEREFQVAPCNHIVFNGKPSPEAISDIIRGAFIKRRVKMDLQEKGRGCPKLLQANSRVQQEMMKNVRYGTMSGLGDRTNQSSELS